MLYSALISLTLFYLSLYSVQCKHHLSINISINTVSPPSPLSNTSPASHRLLLPARLLLTVADSLASLASSEPLLFFHSSPSSVVICCHSSCFILFSASLFPSLPASFCTLCMYIPTSGPLSCRLLPHQSPACSLSSIIRPRDLTLLPAQVSAEMSNGAPNKITLTSSDGVDIAVGRALYLLSVSLY